MTFITFRSQMAALKCKARKTSNHNQVYHSNLLVKKKLLTNSPNSLNSLTSDLHTGVISLFYLSKKGYPLNI